MTVLRKSLIGTEVERMLGGDVTQGINMDTVKKSKVKDAFKDAGFWCICQVFVLILI